MRRMRFAAASNSCKTWSITPRRSSMSKMPTAGFCLSIAALSSCFISRPNRLSVIPITRSFHGEIADAFRANDLQVLERNSTVEYEEQAPHDDGLHTYISIKFPLCDHTGKPYATCGISTDITERKRLEHTLRTHEQQLRLALTSAEVGTWNWDLHTDQIYWSSQVDRFLDLSDRARPRTKNDWLALVYRDDRESMARAMRQAMDQAGADVTFEHRVMRQNGSYPWLVWTGEIIRDRDGKALHILGTVRATTAYRRMMNTVDDI